VVKKFQHPILPVLNALDVQLYRHVGPDDGHPSVYLLAFA